MRKMAGMQGLSLNSVWQNSNGELDVHCRNHLTGMWCHTRAAVFRSVLVPGRGGDGTPKVGVLVGMACDHTRMHVI